MTAASPQTRNRQLVAWFASVAAVLWIGSYLMHPPGEGESIARTMQVVTDHTAAWRYSHLGIAAGYLSAGLAAVLRLRTAPAPTGPSRVAWIAVAVAAVPLVGYLVIESTVAVQAALASDLDGFQLWYGTVATWLWRLSWPVFFAGLATLAMQARSSGTLRRFSTLAAVGAGWAVVAPILTVTGPATLSLSAFITPIIPLVWLTVLTAGRARTATTAPADAAASRRLASVI